MTITELKYFQTVCKYQNFTKAAEECFVTQPTISQAIRNLEEDLGVKLFNRNNNVLTLTKEGEILLKRCNYILNYIHETEIIMKDLSLNHHLLRIGVPPMIGALFFPTVFRTFKEQNPKVEVELFEAGSVLVREAVEKGDIDIGIAIINNVSDEDFNTIKILSTELSFCVHKSHHLATRKSISIKDLNREKVVLFRSDSYQNSLIKEKFRNNHINLDVFLYAAQINTVVNILSYGNVGAFLFKEFSALYDDLVSIPLEEPIKIDVGVIWKRNAQQFSNSKNFINFIQHYFKDRI